MTEDLTPVAKDVPVEGVSTNVATTTGSRYDGFSAIQKDRVCSYCQAAAPLWFIHAKENTCAVCGNTDQWTD
eukprot:9516458-Karenia_brevis.AAC.1